MSKMSFFNRPIGLWLAKAEPTIAELRALWLAQEIATTRLEVQFRNSVARVLDRYARQAAADAAGNLGNFSIDVSLDGMNEDLLREYTRQYNRTINALGNDFFSSLEKSGRHEFETKDTFGIFESFLAQFIADNAAARVTKVADTTRRIIQGAIQKSLDSALGPEGMSRLILNRAGGISSKTRANTIARTETHTAAQFGQQAASQSTGLQFRKYWVDSDDERVRVDHSDAADYSRSTIVKNNEPFQVGGEALQYPGDPSGSAEQVINCRCGVARRPIIPQR